MPVKVSAKGNGKFQVATPNGIKSKSTSYLNAIKQKHLLNAVEHGWKPNKKRGQVARPRN